MMPFCVLACGSLCARVMLSVCKRDALCVLGNLICPNWKTRVHLVQRNQLIEIVIRVCSSAQWAWGSFEFLEASRKKLLILGFGHSKQTKPQGRRFSKNILIQNQVLLIKNMTTHMQLVR